MNKTGVVQFLYVRNPNASRKESEYNEEPYNFLFFEKK